MNYEIAATTGEGELLIHAVCGYLPMEALRRLPADVVVFIGRTDDECEIRHGRLNLDAVSMVHSSTGIH